MSNTNGKPHKDGWRNPDRIDGALFVRPGQKPPQPFTPEEGCFTCLVGMGLLLVSLIFWGWFYWANNPALHPNPTPSPSVRIATPTPEAGVQGN